MNRILKHFKGDDLKAQLLKGVTGTAGLKAINTLLTLGVGILLARTMGPENYGIYAFVLSMVTLLGLPTKAGLPTLVVRETAKNQLKKDWGVLRGLLTVCNGFVLFFSFFISIVSALVLYFLWSETDNVKTQTFLWALCLLPLVSFGNIRSSTLKGLRKVVHGQIPEQLVQPMVMFLLLGVTVLLGLQLTPMKVMQFTIFAALVSFFVGATLLAYSLPREVSRAKSKYEFSNWGSSLVPLSLITGAQVINAQIGLFVLGVYGLNEDAGLYRVALSAASLATIGLLMANPVLAPHIARLFYQQQHETLCKMLVLTSRVCFLSLLPVTVVLLYAGEEIITYVFGESYVGAYTGLVILCIGQVFHGMTGSVGLALKQIGLEKKALYASILGLIINGLLAFLLAPSYGIVGVALAATISISVWNFVNWYYLYKTAGLDTSIFGIKGRFLNVQ